MLLVFTQEELDTFVKTKQQETHIEWCTKFDDAIQAIIDNPENVIKLQYYTQYGGNIKEFLTL